jgi:PPOX class probable F420-dependent enzyme
MVELPESARELIESGAHAHLATINADATPQLSMVWSTIEDGEICIASLTPRQKLANARRDPRVAISYQSDVHDDGQGLTHYLVVRGRARITEGGGPALLRRIASRYLEPGVQCPRGDDPPEGWIMRIAPESWRGHGPWGAGP